MNNLYSWNETATGLARQVRKNYCHVERGVVPLRFIDDTATPPRFVEDGPLVVGVFGNDNYMSDERVRREIEELRDRLQGAAAEEMGFGISEDGESWAMLVSVEKERYQTKVGRALQKELLKAYLEQTVANAWRHVCGLPADTLGGSDTEGDRSNDLLTA